MAQDSRKESNMLGPLFRLPALRQKQTAQRMARYD